MRRQGQYADSSMDSYAAQMQHMSAQRAHHGSGMNHFSGRPDSLPGDKENPYISSKAEAQWQLEKEAAKGPNPVSFYDNEGDGREASRSFYHGQKADSKAGFNKQPNKDPRAQSHEQDMDVGYGDNALPQTFESLTLKFHDEIMKLTKEQQEAEDTENARHREKLTEINFNYHGKLTALRAQHASRRDDFLQRELQARQSQYQQAGMSHHQNTAGPSDPRGYGGAVASAEAIAAAEAMATAEAVNARGQLDLYRERQAAQYIGGDRNHGFESRGSYPGGRAYNTNARYY